MATSACYPNRASTPSPPHPRACKNGAHIRICPAASAPAPWLARHAALRNAKLRPARTPDANQLIHTWLERHRFAPSYEFTREFALDTAPFVLWTVMAAWIPRRVNSWVEYLAAKYPRGQRRVLRVGHRGASAHVPENTLTALHQSGRARLRYGGDGPALYRRPCTRHPAR